MLKPFAAVGAAGAITFLIVGFALGFTNGLSIIVAQRFGANDMDGVRRSVGTGLIFGNDGFCGLNSSQYAFGKVASAVYAHAG